MKLDIETKARLQYHLSIIEKLPEMKVICEVIKALLDETTSDDKVEAEIHKLKSIISSSKLDTFSLAKEKAIVLEAMWLLGFCYKECITPASLGQIIELLQPLAQLGHAAAQDTLAYCYENGLCVLKDVKKAFELYKQAADQGYAPALVDLGKLYADGSLGLNNEILAVKYYEQAAEQGYTQAHINLGWFYTSGCWEQQPDPERALEHYRRAAEEGHENGQLKLGQHYRGNKSLCLVPLRNLKRAALLFQDALAKGISDIHTMRYDAMVSVRFNATKIIREIKKGLKIPKLDNAYEYYEYYKKEKDWVTVGFCLQYGLGCPRNLTEAIVLYKLNNVDISLIYQKSKIQNLSCYHDLLTCYQKMDFLGQLPGSIIQDFLHDLKNSDPETTCPVVMRDKLYCLGLIHENGYFGVEKRLFFAQRYYQMAKSCQDAISDSLNVDPQVENKCDRFQSLIKLNDVLNENFQEISPEITKGILGIIAEYGVTLDERLPESVKGIKKSEKSDENQFAEPTLFSKQSRREARLARQNARTDRKHSSEKDFLATLV